MYYQIVEKCEHFFAIGQLETKTFNLGLMSVAEYEKINISNCWFLWREAHFDLCFGLTDWQKRTFPGL